MRKRRPAESSDPVVTRRKVVSTAMRGACMTFAGAIGLIDRAQHVGAGNTAPDAEEEQPPHWTYDGEEGPEHWGELDPSYASCSGGTRQSPIDVDGAEGADMADIEFAYLPISPLHIVNNGHTIQVNAAPGSSIALNGKTFELQQFHFHTPSEHRVNGEGQALELHLVHLSAEGEIAVVGVLLKEGTENEGLKAVFEAMPVMAGPVQEVTGRVDPLMLLPAVRTTYRYIGSLTTPPCTEGVYWLLMTEPTEVSPEQVESYRKIFELDARPVQPLNDREIQEDTSA